MTTEDEHLETANRIDTTSPTRADARQAAEAIRELVAEVGKLKGLLLRYRTETPLGHQPHMIAHQVDAAISEGVDSPAERSRSEQRGARRRLDRE